MDSFFFSLKYEQEGALGSHGKYHLFSSPFPNQSTNLRLVHCSPFLTLVHKDETYHF